MGFNFFINKFFTIIEYYRYKRRLNIYKTIYVNLRSLPFSIAVKFPIYIYGRCKIISLKGQIEIDGLIQKGVIKIGVSDPLRSLNSVSTIQNEGTIKFGTNVVLCKGINLGCKANAEISIGKCSYIADNVTILSHLEITIGNYALVGNNTVFMDTDFHYLIKFLYLLIYQMIKESMKLRSIYLIFYC